jgi:hypothetical protein
MKNRILCLMAIMLFAIAFALPAFAADKGPDTIQLDEYRDEIADYINGSFYDELSIVLLPDDILVSNAFKIYVDINLFDYETNDIDDLRGILDESEFIYEVPAYVGDDTYIATLSIRRPLDDDARALLTDEEAAQHDARVGSWVVIGVTRYESEHIDYVEYAQSIAEMPDAAHIIVGGVPCFQNAIVLLAGTDNHIVALIPTVRNSVDWDLLGLEESSGDVDIVLDYAEIKEVVRNLPDSVFDGDADQSSEGGGGGKNANSTSKIASHSIIMLSISTVLIISISVFGIRLFLSKLLDSKKN